MLLFANDMDVFPICREAFYFMICSFPDQFAPRVRDKSQNCNPQQQQRIEQAFTPVFNFIYNPTKVSSKFYWRTVFVIFRMQNFISRIPTAWELSNSKFYSSQKMNPWSYWKLLSMKYRASSVWNNRAALPIKILYC